MDLGEQHDAGLRRMLARREAEAAVIERAREIVATTAESATLLERMAALAFALGQLDGTPDPVLEALESPTAEAAARAAWTSWRDQRGPGVTETAPGEVPR
jgi:hypothetical protein